LCKANFFPEQIKFHKIASGLSNFFSGFRDGIKRIQEERKGVRLIFVSAVSSEISDNMVCADEKHRSLVEL
jgi:hypothetical protein